MVRLELDLVRYHEGLGAGGVKFALGFIGLVQLFSALVSGVF